MNLQNSCASPVARLFVICGIAAIAASAIAQWTVVDLTPSGAAGAGATCVGESQQGGWSTVGGSLWTGTAGSWVNLNPAGSTTSRINGCSNGQQAGSAIIGGVTCAGLWSGTAASWVNLGVANWTSSGVTGIASGVEVGSAGWVTVSGHGKNQVTTSFTHAGLWRGSAASWVDLNPAVATSHLGSYGLGAGGGQQVGVAFIGPTGAAVASLWTGTAASWVNLNPAGASGSRAEGTDGTYQAGFATLGGVGHAGMWSGTAASWVDLNPAGASAPPGGFASVAWSEFGGQQAGYATIGGVEQASFWSGSAASWVNLNSFLPGNFAPTCRSVAYGVWQDGSGTTYVVGSAIDTAGVTHALMWVSTVAP